MRTDHQDLPRWLDVGVVPVFNLLVALLVAAIVVAMVGQSPTQVITALVKGALGNQRGISYTLYYATTFVFSGLAVAVAFHAGLFNIGGEGQAMMGGLGAGLLALWLGPSMPAWLTLPAMMIFAAVFAGVWGAVPGYLQAYRGSHVVITTIMLNFLASSIMVYLLVNVLKPEGEMAPESALFAQSAQLPRVHVVLESLGVAWPSSPLNLSIILAVLACVFVYVLLWKTTIGFHIRASGASPGAAQYAGISARKQTILAMAIAGALAGLIAMNEVAGVHHKLMTDFVSGAGFTGIAVALMGRNHPFGIVLSALLFGMISQGGAEVSFEVPHFTKDMVIVLQGLIVLFSGALAYVFSPWITRAYIRLSRKDSS